MRCLREQNKAPKRRDNHRRAGRCCTGAGGRDPRPLKQKGRVMANDGAFRGRRAYWLRQLSDCAESSFEQVLATLLEWGGSAPALWVKAMDGDAYQGQVDPETPLRGLREVTDLQALGLVMGVPVAPVVVPRGIEGEWQYHTQLANACGSLIVDVESGKGFWDQSSLDNISVYWYQLRVGAPDAYLVTQPDGRAVEAVSTTLCMPYYDAVSAQHYVGWTAAGWGDVVTEVRRFDYLRQLGKPCYPLLWGMGDFAQASTFWRAVRDYSDGVGFFRFGTMGPNQFGSAGAFKLPAEPVR